MTDGGRARRNRKSGAGTAKATGGRRGAPPLGESVAALRALAHPLRLRLVELFAEAPRTTKQVAELLGEPPTRLYHHVNALERAGLLRLRETRANRGAVEKWYEASSRWIKTSGTGGRARRISAGAAAVGGGGADVRPASGLALTLLEQVRHEMLSALAGGVSSPAAELPLLVRLVAVGAPKRDAVRARLHALLADLERLGDELRNEADARPRAASAAAADDEQRWAVTIAFAPVQGVGRGRRRETGRG
jgi:DNA-binding transcriptional ArsR family regulator